MIDNLSGLYLNFINKIFFCFFLASFLELVAHTKEYHQTTETFHMIGIKNVSYVEDLHVFWAIPQYAFLGISEVLIGLTGML